MSNKRETGKKWEEFAASYLLAKGYNIIDKNYYTPYGEIDLIGEIDNVIVFIEVKYRSSLKYGTPGQAVNLKKQERLRNSALAFIGEGNIKNRDFRFDVVEILGQGAMVSVNHLINAF